MIEVLHSVQEAFGYLDDDALAYVGASLGVPLSKVYVVATFYSFFTLKPHGDTGRDPHVDARARLIGEARVQRPVPLETPADVGAARARRRGTGRQLDVPGIRIPGLRPCRISRAAGA